MQNVQSLSAMVTVVLALMVPIGDKSLERGMRLQRVVKCDKKVIYNTKRKESAYIDVGQ